MVYHAKQHILLNLNRDSSDNEIIVRELTCQICVKLNVITSKIQCSDVT